jgi:hypothetical protein
MTKIYKEVPIKLSDSSAMSEYSSRCFIPMCPKCGELYLHHGAIHVFFRGAEDATTGTISTCNGHTTTVVQGAPMANSPSKRRDGLSIEMDCEMCGPVGRLTIAQHKGHTLIGWQD